MTPQLTCGPISLADIDALVTRSAWTDPTHWEIVDASRDLDLLVHDARILYVSDFRIAHLAVTGSPLYALYVRRAA